MDSLPEIFSVRWKKEQQEQELGKELVERFAQGVRSFMKEALLSAGDDPLDRVYALIEVFIKSSENPEFDDGKSLFAY